jgi:hypothetical protein
VKRIVVGAIVGMTLAGGIAYAAIPDSGVIHACMLKNIGTIRLIDPALGQKCNATFETAVDWNQKGARGPTGPSGGWSLGGNAGTVAGTNFLGTTDNVALELKVNGSRALRLEPTSDAPNIIGGSSANSVGAGLAGATIVGGGSSFYPNAVNANFGTIAGGERNTVTGDHSTVAGGLLNTASGNFSFAAGHYAEATHNGSFVWSDDNTFGAPFASTATNQFSVRAAGGVRFVTGSDTAGTPTAGVQLAPGGGSWSSLSDRAAKAHLATVDGRNLLDRLAGVPIFSWNYKAQKPSIRHMGPMAQDFYRAFGLGEDNRHIDTIDAEGVALAGIQSLYKLELKQQRQLKAQQRELASLKAQVAKLKGATR